MEISIEYYDEDVRVRERGRKGGREAYKNRKCDIKTFNVFLAK